MWLSRLFEVFRKKQKFVTQFLFYSEGVQPLKKHRKPKAKAGKTKAKPARRGGTRPGRPETKLPDKQKRIAPEKPLPKPKAKKPRLTVLDRELVLPQWYRDGLSRDMQLSDILQEQVTQSFISEFE